MKLRRPAQALRESFSMKAFLNFTVFITIMALSFTLFFIVQQRRSLRNELIKKGALLTEFFAYSSRIGVFSENDELLEGSVRGLMQNKEILSASICASDGRLLKNLTAEGKPGAGQPDAGEQQRVFADLKKSARTIFTEHA